MITLILLIILLFMGIATVEGRIFTKPFKYSPVSLLTPRRRVKTPICYVGRGYITHWKIRRPIKVKENGRFAYHIYKLSHEGRR